MAVQGIRESRRLHKPKHQSNGPPRDRRRDSYIRSCDVGVTLSKLLLKIVLKTWPCIRAKAWYNFSVGTISGDIWLNVHQSCCIVVLSCLLTHKSRLHRMPGVHVKLMIVVVWLAIGRHCGAPRQGETMPCKPLKLFWIVCSLDQLAAKGLYGEHGCITSDLRVRPSGEKCMNRALDTFNKCSY